MATTEHPRAAHALTRRTALSLAAQGGLTLLLAGCGAQEGGAPVASEQTEAATAPVPTEGSSVRPSFLSQASLVAEEEVVAAAPAFDIEPGLANVDVPEDLYLSDEGLARLEQLGFFVEGNGWIDEFYPIYEENRYLNHANYVTVDSLMHTYHLYFQYLLKGLERTKLFDHLARMSEQLMLESVEQRGTLAGTEWEDAARRNTVFFGVALALLDPSASIPASIAGDVASEVSSIESAAGIGTSLVTGKELDYTQFIVRGYYEGDETLERYFRTMMWYGQVSFYQHDEELERSAVLMTLALDSEAFASWKAIYATTSFFAGASDDCGYYEYLPLIKNAYGEEMSVASLPGNDDAWKSLRSLTTQLPAPQINSLPNGNTEDLAANKCFRLMGQRFSIDASMFQQLIYSNVKEAPDGSRRMLPAALDVPAAFGSDEALSILEEEGATAYTGYSEHMDELRAQVEALNDTFWQASLYNQWLHTLQPLLEHKGDGFPSFMLSSEWARRSLESFLGSYTELKHDTVLYSKQAGAEGDGGIIKEHDDRGYVEAEPLLFQRLRNLCAATAEGLDAFGLIEQTQLDDLDILAQLSDQIAGIARKELAGELPTEDEFELIRSIGVQLEHFWEQVYAEEAEKQGTYLDTRQFPAAVVVDVATGGNECLELGTGKVCKMYVVVPVEGKLRVACGPVFSFYQFAQPSSERMTDTDWRDLVNHAHYDGDPRVVSPSWTDGYRVMRQ